MAMAATSLVLSLLLKPPVSTFAFIRFPEDGRFAHHSLKWHARRDSNPQPAVLETAALPIELLACCCSSQNGRQADGPPPASFQPDQAPGGAWSVLLLDDLGD